MKKIICTLCAAVIAALLLAPGVGARSDESGMLMDGDFAYKVSGDGAKIVACMQAGDVTVPESVGGLTVISINSGVFFYRNDITSVHIPSGVESIGGQQFSGCKSLASITVAPGNRVFTARDGVLYTDGGRTLRFRPPAMAGETFAVPEGVTKLAARSFISSVGLYGVTLPDGLTQIGEMAFYCCANLRTVTVPESVESIGASAFEYCVNLRVIELPAGFSQIGSSAFRGTYYVNSTEDDFVTIGDGVLLDYKGADTEVVVPEGIKVILDVFAENGTLKAVTLPATLVKVGDSAFRNCSELKSVCLPAGVTEIGSRAFYGCEALVQAVIPDSVAAIGYEAFIYCPKLTQISTKATVIGESAFESCASLASVTLGSGVTEIGGYAFANCGELTEITLPVGTVSIGKRAFLHCSSLSSVTVPSTVEELGASVFAQCGRVTLKVAKKSAALKYAQKNGVKYEITEQYYPQGNSSGGGAADARLSRWIAVGTSLLALLTLLFLIAAAVRSRSRKKADGGPR